MNEPSLCLNSQPDAVLTAPPGTTFFLRDPAGSANFRTVRVVPKGDRIWIQACDREPSSTVQEVVQVMAGDHGYTFMYPADFRNAFASGSYRFTNITL
jgi:hypothetical protein